MGVERLFQLRLQQEEQAGLTLGQVQNQLAEEKNRLEDLQLLRSRAAELPPGKVVLRVDYFTQRGLYLDWLDHALNRQQRRVDQARRKVQEAAQEWEKTRLEREKLEKILQRRQEADSAKERVRYQTALDEAGRWQLFRKQHEEAGWG